MTLEPELKRRLERCLSHLLSSVLKEQDAPASSHEHLRNAILILAEVMPDFNSKNQEIDEQLKSIQEIYRQAYGDAYDILFK